MLFISPQPCRFAQNLQPLKSQATDRLWGRHPIVEASWVLSRYRHANGRQPMVFFQWKSAPCNRNNCHHSLRSMDHWLRFSRNIGRNLFFNYPLVNVNKKLWKIIIFNGKIHYNWPFSIAMLVYQRVHWCYDFMVNIHGELASRTGEGFADVTYGDKVGTSSVPNWKNGDGFCCITWIFYVV